MNISEQEIHDIKNFVKTLNSRKNSVVVVEGKRDLAALRKIGFSGKILVFHKFGGLRKFADAVSKYNSLIILFDGDRKGKYLTAKTVEQLERRTRIDLSLKKKLVTITKGKIRFIEQLSCYETFL